MGVLVRITLCVGKWFASLHGIGTTNLKSTSQHVWQKRLRRKTKEACIITSDVIYTTRERYSDIKTVAAGVIL